MLQMRMCMALTAPSIGGADAFAAALADQAALSGALPIQFGEYDANVLGKPALGPELVTNGTFDTDTSGWNSQSSTLSIDTGRLLVTNTGAFGKGKQTVSVVANKLYKLSGSSEAGTNNPILRAGSSDGAFDYVNQSGAISEGEWFFTPTGPEVFITLTVNGSSTGNTALFDNISLQLVDTSFPAIEAAVSDTLTIARSSAKMVLNSAGTYTNVASGSAITRSYDPVAGKTGMLIEAGRNQYVLHSVPGTGWSVNDATISDGGTGAVEGQNKAILTATVQEGVQTPFALETLTVSAGLNCAWAVVERPVGVNFAGITTTGFSASESTIFDFTDISVDSSTHAGSGIIDNGGGTYICYAVFDATSDQSGQIRFYISDESGVLRVTDPDGTESVTIHHVQCEPGVYPTSPIITTGSTATTSADDVAATDLVALAVNSATNKTYSARGVLSDVTARQVLYVGFTDASNYFEVAVESGTLTLTVEDGGVEQASISGGAITVGTEFAFSFSLEADDINFTVDGVTATADTSATIPDITDIFIGKGIANADRARSWQIFESSHFSTALVDTDREGLTS